MAVEQRVVLVGAGRGAASAGLASASEARHPPRLSVAGVLEGGGRCRAGGRPSVGPFPLREQPAVVVVAAGGGVGLALAVAGVARLRHGATPHPRDVGRRWLHGGGGLWAWVQTIPVTSLPPGAAWVEPHPFWREPAAYGLTVAPRAGLGAEAGRAALLRLIAYGGAFWAGLLLLRERDRARWLPIGFVGVATAYAVYGIVNHLVGWDGAVGEDTTKAYAGCVTSTFVNRNSFATYANMATLVGLGLLIEPFLKAREADDARRIARETMENLLEQRGALLVAIMALVAGMLLSGSRGG